MHFLRVFYKVNQVFNKSKFALFSTMPRYLKQTEAINIDIELFHEYEYNGNVYSS